MWDVQNGTPFPHHAGFKRDHLGATLWCVHVKATFALRPGRPVLFMAEQQMNQGPRFDGDDLLEDADITLPRPECDLIVLASAPPGRGLLRLGGWSKSLTVAPVMSYDPRNGLRVTDDSRAPVPLRWSASIAQGDAPPRLYPGTITYDPDRPQRCGLNAVPREWPDRAKLGGTYDDAWLRGRAPLLPADLDPAFWQAAPPDQWLARDALTDPFQVAGILPEPASFPIPAPVFEITTRFQGRWHQTAPDLQSLTFDLDAMRLSMLWLATLPVRAVQNDIHVDRTAITLRDPGGFRVPAGHAALFATEA